MLTTDRARSLAPLAVLCFLLFARTGTAQPRGTPPPQIPAQALTEVRTRGTTRVIVGLNVGYTPEPMLGSAAVLNQRSAIAQAQAAVFGRMARVTAASTVRRFAYIPFLALEVDEGDLANLAASPEVSGIEIDAVVPPALAESTPLIGATRAWASGYTGAGWAVAVLDTGIDATHSFLAGKVVAEACYSTTSVFTAPSPPGPRSASMCPGGVDSSTAAGSGAPCALAECNHGTHVAGIAAGRGDSFSGVARDASLISVQVFSRFLTSTDCVDRPAPCALSFFSDQILGLERVYALRSTYNIAAVNISIGGGAFTSPCDASHSSMKAIIDQLRAANIATVVASGNDGLVNALAAPACVSTAISVASTTDGTSGSADRVSNFSNTNQYLSLFAPGETIRSSVPGGGFANFVGTSMAAPHVAGAWAIIKATSPTATVTEVLDALIATGTPIVDPGNGITKPRINVDLAVQRFVVPCTYSVSAPFHYDVGPGSGNVVVAVITQPGCPWTATTLSAFITSPSGQAGIGPGTVTIVWTPNFSQFPREGAVTIAGITITITQQRRMGQADVNFDNHADLIWQNLADGGLATWYLDGSNVLNTVFLGISRVSDTNWRVVGSGDLNGDGSTDLVWQHQIEGWLAVWFLAANQVVDTQFLSINRVVDLDWQIKGVDDIDGDGKADLIWQHRTDGWLAAWTMDGSQVRSTRFLSINRISDPGWQIAGAGDVNADGYPDLIWQHQSEGWLAVWYLRDTAVIGTEFLSFNRITDLNWHVRGVGDVDADNHADLIWQNDVTGQLGVWLLNGAVVVDQRTLSIDRVPDLNWKVVGPG